MKTFLRKLRLSFFAMFCGWIACNIVWWAAWLPDLPKHPPAQEFIMMLFLFGFYMGIVILMAWLVIFLPVDLLLSDHSKLRRPCAASVFGFLAGNSPVWLYLVMRDHSVAHSGELFAWKPFLLLCSPGITGMVAAYMRSFDREPRVNQS